MDDKTNKNLQEAGLKASLPRIKILEILESSEHLSAEDIYRELIKNKEVSVNEFNGEQYLNVEICKKEQEDEWGKTHYVRYDDFDPKSAPQVKETAEALDDDLPF